MKKALFPLKTNNFDPFKAANVKMALKNYLTIDA
jgi:hypothetical protein